MYVVHNVMTRVKKYFHRQHRECVNLPTVPVKIPPIANRTHLLSLKALHIIF